MTGAPDDGEDLPPVEMIEPLLTDHRGKWMRVTTSPRSYGWLLRTYRDTARAAGDEAAFWNANLAEMERFADTGDRFLNQAIAAGRAFMSNNSPDEG